MRFYNFIFTVNNNDLIGGTTMSILLKSIKLTIFLALISYTSPVFSSAQAEEVVWTLHGVALFSGTDPVSKAIKEVTQSPFSHVGIILRDSSKPVDDTKSLACFESTGSITQILRGEYPQVQLNPWDQDVKGYPGGVTTRTVTFDKEPDLKVISAFVKKFKGEGYEDNMLVLVKAVFDDNKTDNEHTMFCSELDAQLFKDLGLFPQGERADNYLPKHFSAQYERPLTGAKYGPEVAVKVYPDGSKAGCGSCTIL